MVLEIIEVENSSHRLPTVPNRTVSFTRSKTTPHDIATQHGHDSSSDNDGTTIQRDCERHQSVSGRMPVIRLAAPRQNSQGRHVHSEHEEGQESHLVLAVHLLGHSFLLFFFFFLFDVEEEDEEPGRVHHVALVWGFQK